MPIAQEARGSRQLNLEMQWLSDTSLSLTESTYQSSFLKKKRGGVTFLKSRLYLF